MLFKLGKGVKNLWESYRRNIRDWNGNCNLTSHPTLVILEACHLHSRREYLGQAEVTVCMQGLKCPVSKKKKKNLHPNKHSTSSPGTLCHSFYSHVQVDTTLLIIDNTEALKTNTV